MLLRKLVYIGLTFVGTIALLIGGLLAFANPLAEALRPHAPPALASLLPPPVADPRPITSAYWLEQNWTPSERWWFHHATQGTATLPLRYDWFIALEQPRLSLGFAGLVIDPGYLERLGFMPSPKSLKEDAATLASFGFRDASNPQQTVANTPTPLIPPRPAVNPDGLPVGFAKTAGVLNPITGKTQPDFVGLTCSACHSGQVTYKGVALRFDGGPGMIDLGALEQVVAISVFYTLNLPGRLDRFAERVLKHTASATELADIKNGLNEVWGNIVGQSAVIASRANTIEGHGRLDALNRIGDQVFFTDFSPSSMAAPLSNYAGRTAPVSFPQIWNAPWFIWAQYDASILQPLIRNVGESLGVAAQVNLSATSGADLYRSSVAVDNLYNIERMLRGADPIIQSPPQFSGLKSPPWPQKIFDGDPAWRIDQAKVDRGRKLYAQLCAGCHLGPLSDAKFDSDYPKQSIWARDDAGKPLHWINTGGENGSALLLKEIPVSELGTDPGQASVLLTRMVDVPASMQVDIKKDLVDRWKCPDIDATGTHIPFSVALMSVVQKVVDRGLSDLQLSDDVAKQVWGTRGNCPNPTMLTKPPRAIYKARPLNGIWATAPYLHNGSVPSLFDLLSPARERPTSFCLGARDFDPEFVGYRTTRGGDAKCQKGETRFASTEIGNNNLGHAFEDNGPRRPGVLGRGLSESERYDLIEYLKTL